MTPEELSFEVYVVLGNMLHLLVHGVSGEDQQRLGLPMDDLLRLEARLQPVRANDMLAVLQTLPEADRATLAASLRLCEQLADTQAEHLLGADAATRDTVHETLLRPVPVAGDAA